MIINEDLCIIYSMVVCWRVIGQVFTSEQHICVFLSMQIETVWRLGVIYVQNTQ